MTWLRLRRMSRVTGMVMEAVAATFRAMEAATAAGTEEQIRAAAMGAAALMVATGTAMGTGTETETVPVAG